MELDTAQPEFAGEFAPPRPLSLAARNIWNRHIDRIHNEGRLQLIDHDLLAVFCETSELYLRCKTEIDAHGVLVRGRTEQELVRNPALTPLNQARADLIRLAKAVPLVDYRSDPEGAAVDRMLSELSS